MLRKGLIILGTVFLGFAGNSLTAEEEVQEVQEVHEVQEVMVQTPLVITEEVVQKAEFIPLTTEDIWKEVYCEVMYENALSVETMTSLAMAEVKNRDLALMSSSTDHIVSYHGKRFAITDDDYQMLLRIVEAEASGEGLIGKILVANVVLNRLEVAFSGANTVSEVIFDKGQFEPVTTGKIFRVTVSEETVEAVEE